MEQLTNSKLLPSWWDEDYYLQTNSDVATAVENGSFDSGFKHFEQHGNREGRNPNKGFNSQYYLEQYPDVVEAISNGSFESAFQHWLLYGQQENRRATPDGIIIPQKALVTTETNPNTIAQTINDNSSPLEVPSQSDSFNSGELIPGLLYPDQSASSMQIVQFDPVTKTQSNLPLSSNSVDGNDINQYLASAGFEGIEDLLQTLGTPEEFEQKLNSDSPEKDNFDQTIGIEPGTVFGPDDRVRITNTRDYPWRSVGQITMQFGGSSYLGSGAMISPYHFLTAGHNIFDPSTGQWANNIKINLGRNGSERFFGEANPTLIRTYTGWTVNGSPNHDWALITLDRNIGNTTGWLGYEWRANTSDYNGMIVNTAGYPSDRDRGGNDMYHATGPVSYANDYRLFYNGTMDTFGGQSGSPVWRDSSVGPYINGIHAYGDGGDGFNKATRIDQTKYNSIQTWRSEDNTTRVPVDRPDLVDYDAWFNTNFASFSTTSVTPGSNFSVRSVVRNNGTNAAGSFNVSFYASSDTNITTSDHLIGNTTISSLNPFNWSYADWAGSFPNIPSGNYYVGWLIDSANSQQEFVENNNTGIITRTPLTVIGTVAPNNDNFVNRITLANPSTTGTNVNATKETGEPNHGGNVGGKSVWWSWTAPASGNYTLSIAGSNFDTLLGLYTGSNVSGLTTIGGNDDANGTLQSQVIFDAVAGTTYQMAVDGYFGASGNIALKLAPTNDNFVNLFTITGSSASATGSNVFASKETGEPNHGSSLGGKSVWWSWTAPASGNVRLSTTGSNFDTLLGVYTGSGVAGLTTIAGNDDANNTLQSEVTFDAVAGTNYKIAVDGFGGSSGAIALNLQQTIPTGEISGLKWNDLNGNSTHDANEPGLSGWTIYLDQNRNGQLDTGETSTTTDTNGNYTFTGLTAGTYTVAEVMQDGWEQTYPGVNGTSSTEPIAITTTNSPVPISTYGEIVKSTEDGQIAPLTDVSGPLVGLDRFRSDSRFAGINGSGFSTVILDTGIDLNHPYFGPDNNSDGVADRIVYQYDFANGDADASDYDGHGSNVSSIVASSNSTHTGMAPGADIIHLKVFTDSGSGNFGYVEQALQWVVANADRYNIASVNMSLGDTRNWNTGQSLYGISDEIAALAARNVMVVSAAGNNFYGFGSAQGVSYPAADPNSLAVGAVYDSNAGSFSYGSGAQAFATGADRITPFSQRHSTLTSIFAPGAPITGAGPTGGTVTMHGTSQAAPHIAGITVLAQQLATQTLGRRLTLDELRNLFSSTGVTINDGDDENDNVTNTGLNFKRVDVVALGEGILAMAAGNGPLGTHTVNLSPGQIVTGKDFGNKLIGNSSSLIDSQSPNWTVLATKDFNGDSKGDIFWRDESTGNNQLWLMNGQTVSSSNNIDSLSANWKVQGVNDFNNDNKADILWRNLTTGENLLWLMDGATVASATGINSAATNWQVEATDDFNGDGKADILWHDPATGQNAIWLMDGSNRIGSGNISGVRANWQVQATDDFNGDGKADILWRNSTTGQNAIWLMNGLSVVSGRNITGAEIAWEVESTDDFNSDGKADIVWRNAATGENQVWLVDGTTIISVQNISAAASRWQIQGTSDFNADSKTDILWRDPGTGENAMWLMDGLNNPTGPLVA